jgi:hydrogenase nickel incorporation protein HypB
VALSVTEGEDKPLKYPVMFKAADLVLLTKCDLLPHLDVRVDAILDGLKRVMPRPSVIQVSARSGLGMAEWMGWLEQRKAGIPTRIAPVPTHVHSHEHHGLPHAHEHRHGDGTVHSHPHAHGPGEGHGHDH